tara:strand:+ start:23 stop:769 length:747 start_codon:yes stop_codon:yes gene_type:complete
MYRLIKEKIYNFLKRYFPKLFQIIFLILNNVDSDELEILKNLKFSGWGLTSTRSPPWIGISKNKTYLGFKIIKDELLKKIESDKFYLSQFYNSPGVQDPIKYLNEMDYRHYVVYYSALLAFENTQSRNIVECGVCDGLTVFFAMNKYKEDIKFKAYLYDSWDEMLEKDLTIKENIKTGGDYNYLNIDMTKKNLVDFENYTIFNKGYIPEIFHSAKNPENLSWLHIDLNSSLPTKESLEFFILILKKMA